MKEPHSLFIVDTIGGRVRERFCTSLLNPIVFIKINKTLPKINSTRLEEPKMCSSSKETKLALEVNIRDRAIILIEINSDLDAETAYLLASHDEYNYYHQLRDKDRLLYRSGQLNSYLEIDI
jgi:hypothetical protein